MLVFNALRACDEVIIPIETGYFAFRAAERQVSTIRAVAEKLQRPIAIRVLPTLFRQESRISQDILAAIDRTFGENVVSTMIREHDVLREAAGFGQPVTEYAPTSDARKDFEMLADWMISQNIVAQRAGGVAAGSDVSNQDAAMLAQLAAPRTNTRSVEPPIVEIELQSQAPPVGEGRMGEVAQRLRATKLDQAV